MQAAAAGRRKVAKKIVWRSPTTRLCVVPGPFPPDLFRSDTRKTVQGAAKLTPSDMYVHPDGTEQEERFALMLVDDVDEILSGENEFGEVSP